MTDTKIFGHRGAAGTSPENTMESFIEAKNMGADGIELDVQMTKDDVLVVIHDEKVDRTTNGSGWVKNFTYEELRQLDASYKFNKEYGFCAIPTLENVFTWAASVPNFFINVELKNGLVQYKNLEEKVLNLVNQYNLKDRVILSSFNHYSMVKCRKLDSEIEIALLFMEGIYEPWDYAKRLKANSIHPYHPVATTELISKSNSNDIKVRPFTVNDEKLMKKFSDDGCSGIFTDYPEKAVSLLRL
ncbi:glycerophosphodiester phosphodiesterase [Bacillus timonensis]|nr:glycerophosphodiester phosphodiesterase [Bacillus timonensis]